MRRTAVVARWIKATCYSYVGIPNTPSFCLYVVCVVEYTQDRAVEATILLYDLF